MPRTRAAQTLNYYSSAAPKLEPKTRPVPRFHVHEGEGRGAASKRAQNNKLLMIFQIAILVLASIFLLSLARVGLTAMCVSELKNNSALKEQVSQAQDKNRSLQVEKAVLSNTSRIATIAEQNYGMVYVQPGSADTITIS